MFKLNKSVFLVVQKLSALEIQSRCASNLNRQSNILRKLMTGKKRSVFKWNDPFVSKPQLNQEVRKTPSKLNTKRVSMLNKMFMRYVTDMIASGPSGYELSAIGLEITRVSVCQKYHGLNIFWTATATDDFDYVAKKLDSINGPLRHELHKLQLMGHIPHITFVRDQQLTYTNELHAIIDKADYGDDYEPNIQKPRLTSDFEIQSDLDQDQSDCKSSLSPMRHDVFGLNHAVIMGRIKQSMAKSKQAWKAYEEKMTNPVPTKPFTFSTSFESIHQGLVNDKQSGDVLKEFLRKRKQMRKQRLAEEKALNSKLADNDDVFENSEDFDGNDDDWLENEAEIQKFYDDYELEK